jgi:hypothetical protein
MHRSLLHVSTLTLLAIGGLCASACASAGPDETFEVSGDTTLFRGTGRITALSAQEAATYRADLAYVHRLLPTGGVPVTLNHADDRQHRFVLARLKLAGKTPDNAPELFKGVADLRAQHIAQGLAAKHGVAEIHVAPRTVAPGIEDSHRITSLDLVNDGTQLQVASMASIHTTLTHGYVDAEADVPDGDVLSPISDLAFVQVFGPMPYASPAALGNLAETNSDTLIGSSMLIEDSVANGHVERFVSLARPRVDVFNAPVITGPIDATGDGCINVCVNRGNNDCDYNLVNNVTHEFLLPIQGNISIKPSLFAQGYRIDSNRVAQFAAGTATDSSVPPAPDAGGDITVTLTNLGGACGMQNATLAIPEQQFWQTATVSNGGQTLDWNMTGANLADFGLACAVAQDHVQLDVAIEVPFVDGNGHKSMTSILISNGPHPSPSQPPLNACFHVIDSCLAAGTMIEMADGRARAIQNVHSGDKVFSPYDHADAALAVMDTTKGTEPIPMVRITDEHGKSLLLTETHPVQVPGRGMVASKYLTLGDVVMTKSGPSRLVHVSRERFTGTVHNLKIGNKAELAKLGKDETAMYANGFLVGDAQIQKARDLAELSQVGRPAAVARVATRWRKDYEHMIAQR